MKKTGTLLGLLGAISFLIVSHPVKALDCQNFVETAIGAQETQLDRADKVEVNPDGWQHRYYWFQGDLIISLIYNFDRDTHETLEEVYLSESHGQCSANWDTCVDIGMGYRILYGNHAEARRGILKADGSGVTHEICYADLSQ